MPLSAVGLVAAPPLVRVALLDPGQDHLRLLTCAKRSVSEPMDLVNMGLPPA